MEKQASEIQKSRVEFVKNFFQQYAEELKVLPTTSLQLQLDYLNGRPVRLQKQNFQREAIISTNLWEIMTDLIDNIYF